LLKINKLGKHLTLNEASVMIGKVFPDIADKLSNTLHLNDNKENNQMNLELVHASIEQRSSQLSAIPFSSAIDLRENKKYLKFLIPILLVFALVSIINPKLFLDGSERIVNFGTDYVEPAPFEFILNSELETKEGEDYRLELLLSGDEIPDEVKMVSSLGEYNLSKSSTVTFGYTFHNLSENLVFHFEANGFKSKEFKVSLLRKPNIKEISLEVLYPKHTGRKSEVFQNAGDVIVPEGSIIKWSIVANNLDKMQVDFKDTNMFLNTSISNAYSFQKQVFSSQEYGLILSSLDVKNADSLSYHINVVKDQFPTISIDEEVDSTNSLKRYIEGKVTDDYGFRSLAAVISVTGKDTSYRIRKSLKINPSTTSQMFSYYVDMSSFDLGPGDKLEYSFMVTDNDEINGYKSTSSTRKIFAVPDLDELDNLLSDQSEKLEDELDKALEDSKKLKKKIKDLKSSMMNKQNLDWKDKQNMESMMNMQKSLDLKIQNLQKQFEKNKNERENFVEESEELMEKQEKLQELMDQLMDDELRELFEELEKLMEEMNKDKLLENLEEMEQETDNMEEKMDRMLELFKNMELDQKLESLEDQLRDLKEEQDALNEKTDDKNISSEELANKQEEINKKFDEIQNDIDEIKDKNDELEKPRDLDFDEELEDGLEKDLEDSKESLSDGKKSKSQKSQSGASDKMEQMADDISAMQSQSQQQQQSEDMDALRFLLENIVALSHDEEDLMDEYKVTNTTDPYYLELNRKQLEIDNATEIVRDSLIALSKRVYQLSSFITDELSELNYNLNKTLAFSEERKTSKLTQYQQYAMTDYNDLSLMLSEVLDQMQQQAQASMPGSGSCDKPGGNGKGKKGEGMSMQQMKDAMKDQIGKMKGGKNPGGKEPGNSQGQGMGKGKGSIPGLSTKDQVKMAAQQAQIRESLKKLKEELNKDGSGFGNGLNDIIKDLDKMENDLLNGDVGSDFINRQRDILTRLLESEEAMRERGYSEERESNEGKNTNEGNQIKFTEYNRKKNAEVEFLRSLPLGLQVYYKTLVNEYFNSVNN
jgi:hypothetical protein